jgi:gamma-glutamyltranspeptidase/glutathione hydrolase
MTGTALALAALLAAGPRPVEVHMTPSRTVVHARHGMVASAHPLATRIGVEVLQRGGTAVDAAIAVNAALGFLEPVSCGVGGDLFAILWDPRAGKVVGLNGSGRAPRLASADCIPPEPDGTIPLFSPFSWTVPGAVDGWFALHARYGRLPMKDLLAPAIRAAEEGEPVPQVIAAAWGRSERTFRDKPGFAATFLPGGRAPREGELFRNPGLARTYRAIAEGRARRLLRRPGGRSHRRLLPQGRRPAAQGGPGPHRSDWVEPISTTYRGARSGSCAQQPGHHRAADAEPARGLRPPGPGAGLTRLLAPARRGEEAGLRGPGPLRRRPVDGPGAGGRAPRPGLRPGAGEAHRPGPSGAGAAVPGDPRLAQGDTTFLAVADGEGGMIALIQSNYTGFGSGYAVEGWGFGLHDRGAQFDLRPGRPNSPGSAPSTIIPALVAREKPWIASASWAVPQPRARGSGNLLDLGMNLQEAGDAPRFYHTDSSEPTGTRMRDGGLLALEPGVPEPVRAELQRRGHRLHQVSTGAFGGYQAVARDPATGLLSGASESRKDGCALGY